MQIIPVVHCDVWQELEIGEVVWIYTHGQRFVLRETENAINRLADKSQTEILGNPQSSNFWQHGCWISLTFCWFTTEEIWKLSHESLKAWNSSHLIPQLWWNVLFPISVAGSHGKNEKVLLYCVQSYNDGFCHKVRWNGNPTDAFNNQALTHF